MAAKKKQQPTKPKIATSKVYIPAGSKGMSTITPEIMRRMMNQQQQQQQNRKRKRR